MYTFNLYQSNKLNLQNYIQRIKRTKIIDFHKNSEICKTHMKSFIFNNTKCQLGHLVSFLLLNELSIHI